MRFAILVLVLAAQSMRLSTCPCDFSGQCRPSAPQPPSGWCDSNGAPSDPCSCPHVESSDDGLPVSAELPPPFVEIEILPPTLEPVQVVATTTAIAESRASPPLQSRLCTFLI